MSRLCPNMVQITVLFCHDPLSHLAIDASSQIKLLMNHCVKYMYSLSTKCAAALLSFRYTSYTCTTFLFSFKLTEIF